MPDNKAGIKVFRKIRSVILILLVLLCVKPVRAQSEVSLLTGISTKNFICGITYRQYENFYNQKIFFVYEERSHADNDNPAYFGFRGGYVIIPNLNFSIGAAYSLRSLDDFSRNTFIPAVTLDYSFLPFLGLEVGYIQYPQIALRYSVVIKK
jgi:hypothetical protein